MKDAVETLVELVRSNGGRLSLADAYRSLMAKKLLVLGVEVEDIVKDAAPRVRYDAERDEVQLTEE